VVVDLQSSAYPLRGIVTDTEECSQCDLSLVERGGIRHRSTHPDRLVIRKMVSE